MNRAGSVLRVKARVHREGPGTLSLELYRSPNKRVLMSLQLICVLQATYMNLREEFMIGRNCYFT